MAKRQIVAGSTSVMLDIFIQDSSVTTGAGLTGITAGTASLTCYYHRNTANASVAVTLTASTLGTYTSSGFIVVDGTNMPGMYQIDLPNAAFAAGATSVACLFKGAANMAPVPLEVELTATDNQDSVRGGMTALPNAAAAASGGLPTIGATIPNATAGATNGLFIAGTNAATTITTALTTTFTGNLTGSVGSVTGLTASNLDTTVSSRLAPTTASRTLNVTTTGEAGINWGDVVNQTTTVSLTNTTISASTAAPTAAAIATAVWQDTTSGDFTVTSSVGKSLYTSGVVPGGSGGLFIAGTNAATTVNVTGNITGNLSGSVGSVTGAVGSVTGAVGSVTGNVTGSIGSLATQAKADVNAEVVDVLTVDTFAEPGQGTPAATTTILARLQYLFKAWRNRTTQTATEYDLYGDDAVTVDQKATTADDGTTWSRTEVASGP